MNPRFRYRHGRFGKLILQVFVPAYKHPDPEESYAAHWRDATVIDISFCINTDSSLLPV
jgi:hypothetical protein